MPELEITIGDRTFEVACQEGEEKFLKAAAQHLDSEAKTLTNQIGRISESRMLLMAGLMLADKTSGLEDQMQELREKIAAQEVLLAELREGAPPSDEQNQAIEALVAKAEALASAMESAANPR